MLESWHPHAITVLCPRPFSTRRLDEVDETEDKRGGVGGIGCCENNKVMVRPAYAVPSSHCVASHMAGETLNQDELSFSFSFFFFGEADCS